MLDIGNVGSRETGKVPPRKLDNEVSLFQSNLTFTVRGARRSCARPSRPWG